MKKGLIVLGFCLALIGCATPRTPLQPKVVPDATALRERGSHYASWSHMVFSINGFSDGIQEDELVNAEKEQWWGEVVR